MYQPSKKTLFLTLAFVSAAGAAGLTYTYWEDISFAVCQYIYPEANEGEARLEDSEGTRYTLLNHGDGKETALYDDNKSLTFHRDKAGNLLWDAGLAGLFPRMAASYYAFHGFNTPPARMDGPTMTYRAMAPLEAYQEPDKYVARGTGAHGYGGRSYWGSRSAKEYEEKPSKRSSFVGRKVGFGSAGARSGSS